MDYNNSQIRRQDRLLDQQRATELILEGEYGVLSTIDAYGKAYGIPISFVWDQKDSLYLHCAPEGKKLICIRQNPNVSFCIVGKTNVIPDSFTTEYESIVIECVASLNLSDVEKMVALRYLVNKYSPDFKEKGDLYAQGSLSRTEIIKLDISNWSGKSKTTILK